MLTITLLMDIYTCNNINIILQKKNCDSPFNSHCFVWGISITCGILPLTTHNYGAAGPWCWIKLEPRPWGGVWMIASFFGISLLSLSLFYRWKRYWTQTYNKNRCYMDDYYCKYYPVLSYSSEVAPNLECMISYEKNNLIIICMCVFLSISPSLTPISLYSL